MMEVLNLKVNLKSILKLNKIIKLFNQNAPHIKAAIVERFNKSIKQKMWRVFTY